MIIRNLLLLVLCLVVLYSYIKIILMYVVQLVKLSLTSKDFDLIDWYISNLTMRNP